MDKNNCLIHEHDVKEPPSKSSELAVENTNSDTVYDSSSIKVTSINSNIESLSPTIGAETSTDAITNKKLPARPRSLNDDARLVKFSLPSNSINFVQSNKELINKSRHFINFITEKSTIIMEKALLSQNLPIPNTNINNNTINDIKMSGNESDSLNCSTESPEINSITPEINDKVCNENEEIIEPLETNIDHDSKCESNNFVNKIIIDDVDKNNDNCELHDEIIQLKKQVEELNKRNNELELGNNLSEIESRDKTIERLISELRGAIMIQEEMRKQYTSANKEKENMVMKYAVGEKQLIETQKAKDISERKIKELLKDNESLQNKLKNALDEKTKIRGVLDIKCRELTDAQKDIDKYKGEIEVMEIKLKWSQNKLKSEIEIYKENGIKLEKAMTKINEMKEECDQVRRESQETIRKFQQLEINKATTLDQQLKEQQAQLILERHITEDKELSRLKLQKEVEMLKNQVDSLNEENILLNKKIQDLDKNRLAYESNFNEVKIIADKRQNEISDLTAKLSNLETMKLQLIHKEQCVVANEMELERLRRVNQELKIDMDCCREREVQMLDFTQKLTDKNVRLQSEFSAIESKANQLENEQGPLRQQLNEMQEKLRVLEDNLANEKSKRIEECEILAKHIAEQTQLSQNLTQMLEDSKGENCVLRRKHQLLIKEMTRELQQCRKKIEMYEVGSANNLLGQTSRASSNTSLDAADIPQNGVTVSENTKTDTIERPILYNDLDKNTLIDRLLKMQRINVRRAEKLDFLEEHSRALVIELQRKTKIIQNYIMRESSDTMGNNDRDKYKAELVRHGGIMASVYNHRVSDDNMTLELSLEINQKLQAVLEDALLKNITLKDNIDTLGEEIARLSIQNQRLQKVTK
ncbi:hypothetical protein PV327_009876 [Microctonus hyperodae]|uniref:Coiled-coil domain-containing protein 186 n=1 Tax=Microctonus hyperodae TaxID=165561 RepID=A0AA39F1V9_MICHY|nr:hypothetical protein PV327_009876 [Microctonus hyperodae]